jgi:hypothetical protein
VISNKAIHNHEKNQAICIKVWESRNRKPKNQVTP